MRDGGEGGNLSPDTLGADTAEDRESGVPGDGTMRRGRPSPEDSRQKLARVLSVASEMFGELGYRAVKMREVADRAEVSTRTLYNHFPDKFSLFVACMDFGSRSFPRPYPMEGEGIADVLCRYGAELVKVLSTDSSLRLGMLVYRDGVEFPELMEVGDDKRKRYVVGPVAAYLRTVGLEEERGEENAMLFLSMILSDWQRRASYRRPMPQGEEIHRHVSRAVRIFLHGAGTAI